MAEETITVQPTITDFEGVETIPTTQVSPTDQQSGAGAAAPDTDTFDEETYIKNLGFTTVEEVKAAKTELDELRKLKEQALSSAEIKFANEQSQKFFEYAKEGKKAELRDYLIQEERLERMSSADVTKLEQAADVIKLNMQLKNKDLTADEINFQFSEDFSIPEKPEQDDEESVEAFQKREDRWKKEVERVEKRMVIAAKQAKPELAKFQSELVLPDIQRVDPKAEAAARKELEDAETEKTQFLAKLSTDYKNFNGFNVGYKDQETEFSIPFTPTDEEKVVLKARLESFATEGYSKYFGDRWFDKEGNPKIEKMMSDIYWLDNGDKILQKTATDSGQKRLEAYIKQRSNIRVNDAVPGGVSQPDGQQSEKEKMEAAIWDA